MCYSAAAAGAPDLARPFAPLILRAELRARARPIQNRQQCTVCSMFPASHRQNSEEYRVIPTGWQSPLCTENNIERAREPRVNPKPYTSGAVRWLKSRAAKRG